MARSIGLVELKSIPAGLETADEMLKAANVELLLATPICPGKYIIVVSGQVGDVKTSVKAGEAIGGVFLVNSHVINNVHEDLPAAITGTAEIDEVSAIGSIETMTVLTAIVAGDIAAKAADIRLIEIRLARGLGGKGYLLFTGEISAVNSAVRMVEQQIGYLGDITGTCAIASPDKALVAQLL